MFGVPDSIRNNIKEHGGSCSTIWCTSCRLEGGSSSTGPESGSIVDGSKDLDGGASEQAVKQLSEAVKCLCVAVGT